MRPGVSRESKQSFKTLSFGLFETALFRDSGGRRVGGPGDSFWVLFGGRRGFGTPKGPGETPVWGLGRP